MILSVHKLSVTSRLQDVSAAFAPGKITAICGPNGAGKSTLLSALAGLLKSESGEVRIDGDSLANLAPRERAKRIGFLPQNGEVAWDVAVRNLITLGRIPHGDAAQAPVDQAIMALDLAVLQDRPISKLSGGERGRALLARVLAGEPDWILADEPLAALDIAHQLALIGHLRKVADDGAGVVIVLHDLALAMNHADRVLVLDQGRLAANGTPEEALSEAVIADVWGVKAKWIGEEGAKALVSQ
ncbi:ABC transporter ATP-binding protein [Pontixanthobacter gangjinensis]|uniref:ATP-binding cassette domain-containing protein n=1 Tax=Pontixanthobacter gangjinensis TaxID=1028742 RepID=A0A6I4SLY0_9SPHN|nr:ABC transporter ATP-binding protein [Pontixanthobacter gangjinensis]MXO56684.1 ATP-binding cassette domain-containing protein [Pontixanthobacter gangjinensis]